MNQFAFIDQQTDRVLRVTNAASATEIEVGVRVIEISDWHGWPVAPTPGARLMWRQGGFEWDDSRTLTEAKVSRSALMRDARDAAINGSFIWDGSAFDADQVSQTRIMGLKVASADAGFTAKAWRLADNSWRVLSAADAAGVWAALEAHVSGHFTTFAGLDAAIQAATTLAAVDQVSWP
jgi:hypothetical protein